MLNHEPERAAQHRRQALASALAGAAGGLLLSSSSDAAETSQPVKRTALHPSGAPAADVGYSPAIVSEGGRRLLFISGQGPEDLKADMETQIRQTFDRIGLLLKEAGGSFANVVIVRSYWVHMLRDLAAF